MDSLKKFELFNVPQMERAQKMREVIPIWMQGLANGEQLIIGLPEVLCPWSMAIPLVVGREMISHFREWIDESESYVNGKNFNLPELTAGFLLIVIDDEFNAMNYEPPTDADEELVGVLKALAAHERAQLRTAAA